MDIQIRNLKALQAERIRLIAERNNTAFAIENDIRLIRHSFNPLKMVLGFAKNILFNNQNGIVNDSFRNAIGSISSSTLLKFLPFPIRMVSSYLLKNYVTNYVFSHKDQLAGKALNIFSLVKKIFSKQS